MTKEELARYSMEELNQMIEAAIQRSHIEFLKQLTHKEKYECGAMNK